MIKIGICDDDSLQINSVKKLINKYNCCKTISCIEFNNPLNLLNYIEENLDLDILLLDIVMPNINGIELGKKVKILKKDIQIIFLTSSKEFALESYDVDAYYYAIKPIKEDKLFELLDKLVNDISSSRNDTLLIQSKNTIIKIFLSQLVYCEVIGKSIYYHLIDGSKHKCTGAFYTISEQLIKYNYLIQPHRSYVVNMNYIDSITGKEIILNNTCAIPIARGNYAFVKESYMNYYFNNNIGGL